MGVLKAKVGGVWQEIPGVGAAGVPLGGATNDLLRKKSGTDLDMEWIASRAPGVVTQYGGQTFGGALFGSTYVKCASITFPAVPYRRLNMIVGRFLFEYPLVAGEQMDVQMFIDGADQFVFHRGLCGVHMNIPLGNNFGIQNANVTQYIELRARSVTGTTRNLVDANFSGWSFGWP